jgi:hypothetical protein
MTTLVSILGPVATLIVGLAVAYIAWQQWQVASNKLRLDLFDRRYKIYDATRKFLEVITRDREFEDSQLFEFYAGTSDAAFFFDAAVVDYLSQIRERALKMRTPQGFIEKLPRSELRHYSTEPTAHEQLLWLCGQITVMTKVFAPYLDFSRIKLSAFPLSKVIARQLRKLRWTVEPRFRKFVHRD